MMKFFASVWTYIKRKWWYLLLLVGSTIFVCFYGQTILESDFEKFTPITLVFILWLALLLLPLFSEMEFLGVKLKKEVEEVKTEVKAGLSDIKMQMLDLKINTSFANNIQIELPTLPSEKQVDDVLEANPIHETSFISNVEYGVSEQSIKLFQVRLATEKLVSDICDKIDFDGRKSFNTMIQHLNLCEFINGKTVDLARQIYNISSRGIHGEIISDKYMEFVNIAFPEVQSHLLEVQNKLTYQVCPRCKNASYSLYSNFCPKCKYTHNDE